MTIRYSSNWLSRNNDLPVRTLMLLILLVSFIAPPAYAASFYKCKDAAGRTTFQDSPCGGAQQEKKIHILRAPAPVVDDQAAESESANTAQDAGKEDAGKDASTTSKKSFAWRISRGKKQGYLMGSIHFGKAEMYPLAKPVEQAFKNSDALVVEANVLDVDQMQMTQIVMNKGMYTDGTTLSKVLDKKTLALLNVTAANLGLPGAMLEGQKPWFASMTLTSLGMKKIGLSEELGIDQHFLKQAKQMKKPIRELESVEQQLEMMSSFSHVVQVAMLKQTLEDMDKAEEYFDEMYKAWRSGEPKKLDKLFMEDASKSTANAKFMKVMIDDRNVTMSRTIDRMMTKGCNCFVVVGAGHLGGNKGIIKLLEAKGYKAEQL